MEFSRNGGRGSRIMNRKGMMRSADENKTHLVVYQRRSKTQTDSPSQAPQKAKSISDDKKKKKPPPIQKSPRSDSEEEEEEIHDSLLPTNNDNVQTSCTSSLHTEDNVKDDIPMQQQQQQSHDAAAIVKKKTTLQEQIPDEEIAAANVKLNPEDDPHVQAPSPLSPNLEIPVWDELQEASFTKFHNIVDLVMWKDISKSAFVFGFGSFLVISSSLVKDVVSFSMVSVISYMALFYLAATFFYKSILQHGNNVEEEFDEDVLVVGEEEAIWLLHFILPYLNAFLFNLKTLFSGDPATTFNLALLLFLLARSGNSLTLWIMAKSAFVSVFTLPKLWSLYSTQITRYGHFWIRRFGDAWDSCSHKKLVAAFTFTVVWNLSSITARIWAAFMLLVAVRYYQQSLCSLRGEWHEPEINGGE